MSTTNTVSNSKKSTKASKQAKEEPVVVAAPATVTTTTVEVAVTPAPVASTKSKKRSAKVEDSAPLVPVSEQSVVVEATQQVETVPQVETAQTEGSEETKYTSFEEVMKAIAECDKVVVQKQRERAQLIKIAQKYHAQVVRQVKKKSKSDSKSTKRAVSGFNKPAPVPAAFCGYLGLTEGQELPRTAVTALLYQKIKELNLLNPEDKREIQADAALRELFRMEEGEVIKFNNFQKFVSRVYKGDVEEESSEDEATA
jgi:chromatin remodeling complex protein RSC6